MVVRGSHNSLELIPTDKKRKRSDNNENSNSEIANKRYRRTNQQPPLFSSEAAPDFNPIHWPLDGLLSRTTEDFISKYLTMKDSCALLVTSKTIFNLHNQSLAFNSSYKDVELFSTNKDKKLTKKIINEQCKILKNIYRNKICEVKKLELLMDEVFTIKYMQTLITSLDIEFVLEEETNTFKLKEENGTFFSQEKYFLGDRNISNLKTFIEMMLNVINRAQILKPSKFSERQFSISHPFFSKMVKKNLYLLYFSQLKFIFNHPSYNFLIEGGNFSKFVRKLTPRGYIFFNDLRSLFKVEDFTYNYLYKIVQSLNSDEISENVSRFHQNVVLESLYQSNFYDTRLADDYFLNKFHRFSTIAAKSPDEFFIAIELNEKIIDTLVNKYLTAKTNRLSPKYEHIMQYCLTRITEFLTLKILNLNEVIEGYSEMPKGEQSKIKKRYYEYLERVQGFILEKVGHDINPVEISKKISNYLIQPNLKTDVNLMNALNGLASAEFLGINSNKALVFKLLCEESIQSNTYYENYFNLFGMHSILNMNSLTLPSGKENASILEYFVHTKNQNLILLIIKMISNDLLVEKQKEILKASIEMNSVQCFELLNNKLNLTDGCLVDDSQSILTYSLVQNSYKVYKFLINLYNKNNKDFLPELSEFDSYNYFLDCTLNIYTDYKFKNHYEQLCHLIDIMFGENGIMIEYKNNYLMNCITDKKLSLVSHLVKSVNFELTHKEMKQICVELFLLNNGEKFQLLCLTKLRILHKLKENEEFLESTWKYAYDEKCESLLKFLNNYDFSQEIANIIYWC